MGEGSGSDQFRKILGATAASGGASIASVLLGILRTKVVAVALGPDGVGVLGVLSNILAAATTTASAGLATSGVREIAEAAGAADTERTARSRTTIVNACVLLGLGAATAMLASSRWIAAWAFHEEGHAWEVALLGAGVLFSVLNIGWSAVLVGLRRVRENARSNVLAALVSTAMAVGGVTAFGLPALVVVIVLAPAVTSIFLWRTTRRVEPLGGRPSLAEQRQVLGRLLRLGATLVVVGLVEGLAHLAIRRYLIAHGSMAEAGYFQAAWTISTSYMGIVLGALAVDYYPRLTAGLSDHALTQRTVSEQMALTLYLIGPLCLLAITLGPHVVKLLYSADFGPATEILRWQMLGDIWKGYHFVLGFLLLARGQGLLFMAKEIGWYLLYLALLYLGFPLVGRAILGIGFLLCAIANTAFIYYVAVRPFGLSVERRAQRFFGGLLLAASAVLIAARYSENGAMVLGLAASAVFAFLCARFLNRRLTKV